MTAMIDDGGRGWLAETYRRWLKEANTLLALEGWLPFGAHADEEADSGATFEFYGVAEDGLPLYERKVPHAQWHPREDD